MKRLILFFTSAILFSEASSQNLVPNPGFEESRCTGWYISSIESCKRWFNPTMASPDYFNNSCISTKVESIPSKYYGGQSPVNGVAYAGFIAAFDYKRLKLEDPKGEYIQVKLKEPLVKGETYFVKADLSLAECSRAAVNAIGFYFSPTEVKSNTVTSLTFEPQVVSHCNLKDTTKWVTSIESFVATGDELYLIIGTFNGKQKVELEKVTPSTAILDSRDYAYYFIDNVVVEKAAR